MIISILPFFKKLNYYREIAHEIVDVDKLYECFIDLYDNFLFSKLSQHFQSSTLSYLKNNLEPVKNYFLCSDILFHLFNCPRSSYAVNDCSLCSRVYIDPLVYPEQTVDLHDNTNLRYKVIKNSIFAYDVKQLFNNNFITEFRLNICYKSLEQYTILNFDQKRCLQLSVFQNECDIIIKYCEVLVRIFLDFFNSVSKLLAGFEKQGKLKEYFGCCLRFTERLFEKMVKLFYVDKFKETFLHYESENDYNLSYIRIINEKYSEFCIKSLKMQIKLFIYKLQHLMKEKYPQIKIDFYCSHRNKNIHIGINRALFFFFSEYPSIIKDFEQFFLKNKTDDEFIDLMRGHP